MDVGMRATSHISSKGQVTVPVEIRHRMGLKSGDVVEFSVEQGQTILRPARASKNPFLDFLGALPAFSNIGQIQQWVRELREPEETPSSQTTDTV